MKERAPELKILLRPSIFLTCAIAPQLLLAAISWYLYTLISSELQPLQYTTWNTFAGTMSVLAAGFSAMATSAIVRKRELPWYFAPIYLALYGTWLYYAYWHIDKFVPDTIPAWMVRGDEYILAPGAFVVPGLLYSTLIIVFRCTPQGTRGLTNFFGAVGTAVIWYFFFQGVLPLLNPSSLQYNHHLFTIVMSIGAVAFVFFLMRWMVVSARRSSIRMRFILRVLFGIVLPLTGLYVNSSFSNLYSSGTSASSPSSIYGDFTSLYFPLLAIANGIALLFPLTQNLRASIFVFALRSSLLPFTLYFFLAFMPLVPFALLLVALYGIGILILTPTILLILQGYRLADDLSILRKQLGARTIALVGTGAFLILPAIVIGSFINDRMVLNAALRSIRYPDYVSGGGDLVNLSRLTRTLQKVNKWKTKQRSFMASTPFLDALYQYIVFDNLTVADTTIKQLVEVFELSLANQLPARQPESNAVRAQLRSLEARSTSAEDSAEDAIESTITLTIKHSGALTQQEEFSSEFNLPAGTWINKLALRIGTEDVPGMVVEKQAAQWIYQQIVSVRRDPAILFYSTPDRVHLRVFPVTSNEDRIVTLKIMHKDPFTLQVGDFEQFLGEKYPRSLPDFTAIAGNLLYVSESARRTLPKVRRRPFPLFIVECERNRNNWQSESIEKFLPNVPVDAGAPRFMVGSNTFVNFTGPLDWRAGLARCERTGAFNLDFALKSALVQNFRDSGDYYPVPIVVSKAPINALPKELEGFLPLVPEVENLHFLSDDGVTTFGLPSFSAGINVTPIQMFEPPEVLAWPSASEPRALLRKGAGPAEVPLASRVKPEEAQSHSQPQSRLRMWQQGLELRSRWFSQLHSPRTVTHSEWMSLVDASMKSGILTPVTSYLALETEAQREALRRLHSRRMAGSNTLDAGELRRLDEPSVGVVIVVLLIAACILRIKRSITAHSPGSATGTRQEADRRRIQEGERDRPQDPRQGSVVGQVRANLGAIGRKDRRRSDYQERPRPDREAAR